MLRRSFRDRRRGGGLADDAPTFEETYPRYEFAELVRLALAAGAWLAKMRRRVETHRNVALKPLPGDMNPAE